MNKTLVGLAFLHAAITSAYGGDGVSSDSGKSSGAWGSDVKSNDAPSISLLLKPQLLKRVLGDKEIIVHASLVNLPNEEPPGTVSPHIAPKDPGEDPKKKYSIYASMLVGATPREAYSALTDYKLYSKLVPFIESAVFSPMTRTLLLEGGIWNFRLSSQVLFAEQLDRWIHFDIISGHFAGLSGNIYFESRGEKGTLIYLCGEQIGTKWPPTFVIERGAEIVFGFTAQRMRSYIESAKKAQQGAKHGEPGDQKEERQFPEPRSHL